MPSTRPANRADHRPAVPRQIPPRVQRGQDCPHQRRQHDGDEYENRLELVVAPADVNAGYRVGNDIVRGPIGRHGLRLVLAAILSIRRMMGGGFGHGYHILARDRSTEQASRLTLSQGPPSPFAPSPLHLPPSPLRLPQGTIAPSASAANGQPNHREKDTTMSVFLGIDIGTSGTKTLAIDDDGQDPGRRPWRPIPATSPSRCGASRIRRIGGRRRSSRSAA